MLRLCLLVTPEMTCIGGVDTVALGSTLGDATLGDATLGDATLGDDLS